MSSRPSILKKQNVRLVTDPIATGEGVTTAPRRSTASRAAAQPQVNVRRNGEFIEALEVTCPCGHLMVIECLYDAKRTEVTP